MPGLRRLRRYGLREFLPLILGLVGIVVVVVAIPQAVQYLGRARGFAANIVVDLQATLGPMPKIWRNLAQGGEESKAMLGAVTEDVRRLQPEYIRIDHIYDAYNVVSKQDGRLVYDWSRLDGAVDEILSVGARPFLSLSYMPPAISKSDVVDLPADWNEWSQLVQATIEHFSGRQSRNLSGVIYEVWNEPDLFGDYKVYGDRNYLTMYDVSARAAMRANNVNVFEIGGPATTGLYKNWVETLIKFASDNGLRLDFVSWHRYSTNLEQFERDAQEARSWAEGIPALTNLRFYVTEWGHDSENDDGYDTRFGAIQTLAGVRTMMGRVDRAFVFEIKDGPGNQKLWGRWGLLTHEKFGKPEKKPRYFALEFLNRLEQFRVSLAGEGSWVKGIASTNGEGDVWRILLINYDPQGKHAEAVPLTFENLPSLNFSYVRENFLGEVIRTAVATTSAVWKTVEHMPANSAAMVTLEF